MTKPYKLAVVIGRFQIFHNGHKGLIDHALSIADHVLVIIGSANEERTTRNPFSAVERHEMIHSVYPTSPIAYHYQEDNADNLVWAAKVTQMIDQARRMYGAPRNKTALVGYRKDETSFYLDFFPEYEFVPHESEYVLHSTDLREIFFRMQVWKFPVLSESVPGSVYDWLMDRLMRRILFKRYRESGKSVIFGNSVRSYVVDDPDEFA